MNFDENEYNKLPEAIEITKSVKKPLKKTVTSLPQVSPENIDYSRRQVLDIVQSNMGNVRAVLAGRLRWTNQQVKLFQIMMNKVLPDLSASMNEHIHKGRSLEDLSRSELEALVAKAGKLDKEDPEAIIEASYKDVTAEEAAEMFDQPESPDER